MVATPNPPRPSEEATRLGYAIMDLRQNAGLNHQDVAAALGISFHLYFCIETGNHIPDAFLLKKISDLYHVSLDTLLETAFASNAAARKPYMVLEIANRSLPNVIHCNSLEDAIRTANELLEDHAKQCGNLAAYMAGKGDGDEWCRASEDNLNAWCNWNGMDWDAYIIESDTAIKH